MTLIDVYMFKMPFVTKHFNLGQKLWVIKFSGNMACEVIGKFRGSGRYVKCWVCWDNKQRLCPEFKEIAVKRLFCEKHKLMNVNNPKLVASDEKAKSVFK